MSGAAPWLQEVKIHHLHARAILDATNKTSSWAILVNGSTALPQNNLDPSVSDYLPLLNQC